MDKVLGDIDNVFDGNPLWLIALCNHNTDFFPMEWAQCFHMRLRWTKRLCGQKFFQSTTPFEAALQLNYNDIDFLTSLFHMEHDLGFYKYVPVHHFTRIKDQLVSNTDFLRQLIELNCERSNQLLQKILIQNRSILIQALLFALDCG